MVRHIQNLRAGPDREIAQRGKITSLIAENLAVGAHLLQIDKDHAQRRNDFLAPDEQRQIVRHLHIVTAIDIRQTFLHTLQTLPGIEVIVEINMLVAFGRAVGVLVTHSHQRAGEGR